MTRFCNNQPSSGTLSQKIRKPNNLKIFWSRKTKGPKKEKG
jgi:hypothetical protein